MTPFPFHKNPLLLNNQRLKDRYHHTAIQRLASLAIVLDLTPGEYSVTSRRMNQFEPGEIVLNHPTIRVVVYQRIVPTDGSKDVTFFTPDGPSFNAPASMLNDIPALARRIRRLAFQQHDKEST